MAVDSQVVVKSLMAVDPQFVTLCKALFGDTVDPVEVWTYLYTPDGTQEVAKAGLFRAGKGGIAGAKMTTEQKARMVAQLKRRPRDIRNMTMEPGQAMQEARRQTAYSGPRISKMNPSPSDIATRAGRLRKRVFRNENLNNALVNGVVSGVTGAGAAGAVAARNNRKQSEVGKGFFRLSENMTNALVGGGVSGVAGTAATVAASKPKKKKRPLTVVPPSEALGKSASVTWDVEFSKIDEDKRQVFGWASIVELDGQPVIDRQGDYISADEIEKAAYQYVVKSRAGGHQHKRTETGEPFHASDMIESIVFTPEKIEKMHLPQDFPVGWWVGFKVNDEEAWQKVKKGEVTGFSVHGKGKRQEVA